MVNSKKGKNPTGHPITHGISYFRKSGEFHPSIRQRKQLKQQLESLRKDLNNSLEGMNTQKEVILNETIRLIGIMWLAGLYINKMGIFDEHDLRRGILNLQPFFGKQMIGYMNTLRLNLTALGLESKQGEVMDAMEYTRLKYGDDDKKDTKK